MIQELITGRRTKQYGAELYTITANAVRYAAGAHRGCLGICPEEEPERKKFLAFMQEEMKAGTDKSEKEKLLRMIERSGEEASPYVEEFHSLMRELVGTLVAQACEMAALVLQYYCIDEKSIKEISEIFHVPENTIELMAQYYERKKK